MRGNRAYRLVIVLVALWCLIWLVLTVLLVYANPPLYSVSEMVERAKDFKIEAYGLKWR